MAERYQALLLAWGTSLRSGDTLGGAPGVGATAAPEVMSRLRQIRSVRKSAAFWQRSLRSFSSALRILSSSLGGVAGFTAEGETGSRFRIASKTMGAVSPQKACRPVAIS